jgi:hypothetical protein
MSGMMHGESDLNDPRSNIVVARATEEPPPAFSQAPVTKSVASGSDRLDTADAGGPLTAIALAGHLAQYAGVGGKIEWDVEQMKCTNKPEFNQFVRREYRSGWEV